MAVRNRSLIGIVIVVVVLLAVLLLYLIPDKRIVGYKIMVQSTPLVVFKDLTNKQNWQEWLLDSTSNKEVELTEDKEKRTVQYVVRQDEEIMSEGMFIVQTALSGSTVLENKETLHMR